MELDDYDLIPDKDCQNFFYSKYTAENKTTNKKYSVTEANIIIVENMLFGDKLKNQIQKIGLFDHPNIQYYFNCFYSRKKIYLFLENEERSFYSLFNQGLLDQHSIFLVFRQIVNAVSYLHSNNIAHLDICPKSFFINKNNVLKLGNFYEAQDVSNNQPVKKVYGTQNFAPPESKCDKPSYDGKAADVWACGVMLISIITNELAVPGTNQKEIEENFDENGLKIPSSIQGSVRDLIKKMVEMDPKRRIKIDEVKQHPWFIEQNEKEKIEKSMFPILSYV